MSFPYQYYYVQRKDVREADQDPNGIRQREEIVIAKTENKLESFQCHYYYVQGKEAKKADPDLNVTQPRRPQRRDCLKQETKTKTKKQKKKKLWNHLNVITAMCKGRR